MPTSRAHTRFLSFLALLLGIIIALSFFFFFSNNISSIGNSKIINRVANNRHKTKRLEDDSNTKDKNKMHRFCVTTLSKSRIVFTGECASTIHNTACMKLLVMEFHRATAATEPPISTSIGAPLDLSGANASAKRNMQQRTERQTDEKGRLYSSKYILAFVATKSEAMNSVALDTRREQLQNLANSGVCNVVVLVAPDLAGNRAAVSHFVAICGVTVIDVNHTFSAAPAAPVAAAAEGKRTAQQMLEESTAAARPGPVPRDAQAAAYEAACDELGNMACTPRQWAAAVAGPLWTFVCRSRICSGSLTVHCWGDSLTEGYTFVNNRLTFVPYARFLMSSALPQSGGADEAALCIPCVAYGVSGETTSEIRRRFDEELALMPRTSGAQRPGDIAVFLAGTNDLGTGVPWQSALNEVKKMAQTARERGMSVIIVSIPSTATAKAGELYDSRTQYNAGLRALVEAMAESGAGPTTQAHYVDFFTASSVPSSAGEEVRKLRPDLAADNLHLTPDGYKLLAECVGAAIKNIFR